MRFWKLFPALTIAAALSIAACGQRGGEEAETELTPADTATMAPPPAEEPMGEDTGMMGDTGMMHDTTMMEGGANPSNPQ